MNVEGEIVNELMKKLSLKKISTPSSNQQSHHHHRSHQYHHHHPTNTAHIRQHHHYNHHTLSYHSSRPSSTASSTTPLNVYSGGGCSVGTTGAGYDNVGGSVIARKSRRDVCDDEGACYRFLASLSDTRLTTTTMARRSERQFEWRRMRMMRQVATFKSDYLSMHKCTGAESDSGSEKVARSLHSCELNRDRNSNSELTPISARAIKIKQRIGEGEFGYVYDGLLLNNSGSYERVALKKLKVGGNLDDFLKEARILSSLNHSCIVKVYGVCYELKIIALELVKLGSLNKYLRNNAEKLTTDILKLWSFQVADGMMYLELNKLVHRDLASRNILVSSINQIKISDFGMTRKLESFEVYLQNPNTKIPFRWYPLESIEKQQFTGKSDVWSYGVTVWEIFSLGETPYAKLNFPQVVSFLRQGMRLNRPCLCTQLLYNLLMKCWNANPDLRPSFAEIVKYLNRNYHYI